MVNPFLIRSGASSAPENSFPEGTPASAPQPAGVLFPQPALPGASSPGDTPVSSPAVPEPVSYRSFGDIPAVRQAIFDRIQKAASGLIPVENNRYSLTLGEVHYADRADPEPEEIKRAVLAQDSLTKALKGTWTLTDKLNGTVSRRKTVVAKVPYLLDNGTFLRNGTKYVLRNQSRLLPGVYTRKKENGEYESHVNADMREGAIHHYGLDPATGKLSVLVAGSKTPIYALAKALGALDEEMEAAWGKELFLKNMREFRPAHIAKLYEKMARGKKDARDDYEREAGLRASLEKIRFDPEVMEITLGKRYTHMNKDVLLDATRKLLRVAREEEEEDDRDSLAFQEIYGPEDLFEERLSRDAGSFRRALLNQLTWKYNGNIGKLPAGALTKQLDSVILGSGLANGPEEINALEILDKAYSLTKLGSGGLPNTQSIPGSSRDVHPSQRAFVDPSRTPESVRIGVDTYLAAEARKGSDRQLYAPVLDRHGERRMLRPKDMLRSVVAVGSEYRRAADDEFLPVMKNGREGLARKNEVDYIIPHFEGVFSPLANLIPFKSAAQGNRVAMGSRMLTQALPMKYGEAPYVQSGVPGKGDYSYYQEFGKAAGAVFAEQPATVLEATDRHVLQENADGTRKRIPLAYYFPGNRKTFLHATPVVTVGQKVQPGDLLVKSNMTDDQGQIALGLNARVVMMPWKGMNFEDAIVVSESFAKRAVSQQMYQHRLDRTDDYKTGKHSYMGIFPSVFQKEQLDRMDEHGVVRPGMTVHKGDPLILAARLKDTDKRAKKNRRLYSDASVLWEHHDDGVVTDVFQSDKGVDVLVRTESPLRESDKLCFDGKTEVLTEQGWKPVAEITLQDKAACLIDGRLCYEKPEAVYRYPEGGRMYRISSRQVDLLVTENHRMYVKDLCEVIARDRQGGPDDTEFRLREAGEIAGKPVFYKSLTEEIFIDPEDPEVLEEFIDHYDKPVYCVTVPGHVLYVRRNGKAVWSGNSNRFGSKGVVRILPDDEMPLLEDGTVAEVAQSPAATVSRGNPVQLAELALGKIAMKTGKVYRLADFEDIEDIPEFVERELEKYGISPETAVIDRKTGKKIINGDGTGIADGSMWFMKLHHTGESKGSARGLGGYSADGSPSKGGTDGAKRMAPMHLNALVSHGAYNTFMDAKYARGQANEDYWLQYMQGINPQLKKTPLVYEKFENSLRASGIQVAPSEGRLNLLAMTGGDVAKLAGDREVRSGETLQWEKSRNPVAGGLFDPALFGMDGSRWAKITPTVPVLNPVMEEPARILLGLTQKGLREVMSGETPYGKYGTGFRAVSEALDDINVSLAMNRCRSLMKTGTMGQKDHAVRALGYLKACEQTGIHPREWMLDKIPVLPPKFRPVSEMKDTKVPLVDDANYLYRLLIDTNNGLKELRKFTSDTKKEEYGLYEAYKQVTGLAEPVHPKLVQRQVRGLLKHVFGVGSSKFSMVQRNLLGTPADMVGRAVVVPDSDLSLNEIGIPEDKAWEVYRPHLVHRLTRRGIPWAQAAKYIEERDPVAKEALLQEMEERPVIVDRAPVLHKWGVLAFKPKLVQGDAMHANSLVQKGYGLDNDGNCTDFNTEIFIKLSESYLQQPASSVSIGPAVGDTVSLTEYREKLEESLMPVYGEETITLLRKGRLVPVKIGLLPRRGVPVKDKNGADVYSVPDGVYTLSYDVTDGKQYLCPVRSYTVEKNVSCAEVTTSGGRRVVVSENESLAAYNHETGLLDKIAPAEAAGRLVPVVKRCVFDGQRSTRNIGWFYGALISDGWVSSTYVGYAKVDASKRAKFLEVARNEIEQNFTSHVHPEKANPAKNKFADSIKLHLTGKDLISKIFPCVDESGTAEEKKGRKALRKCIPSRILYEGSRECLLGLLAGLLEGDGTLVWNHSLKKPRARIAFSTSSPRLAEDFRVLGVRLGFNVSVTTMPPRGSSNTAYTVNPSIPDMWNIFHELEFVSESAKKFQQEFLALPCPGNRHDLVPVLRAEMEFAASLLPAARNTPTEIRTAYSAFRKAMKDGYLSREGARKYLAYLPEEACPELRKHIAQEEITWEKYESVEPVEPRDVFDIAVEGTKVFVIANGLVIYDTMNFHVPMSAAVKEAYALLLPEKSLIQAADMKSAQPRIITENMAGLYLASLPPDKREKTRTFATWKDAEAAYKRGDLAVDDPLVVLERKT